MNIMMNRASFARSSMLANWRGQSPQTDEQRRAMFARLGGGGGRNAVAGSATSYRYYPENPPEQAKDPRGEIRAETWQDRLRMVVDAAGRIGYVGEPDSGDPTWKYALATAAGILLPFPGGKVKAAGKVADAVAEASTAIKQARSLQAQALRLRRLAAKTTDPTEQSWLLEMAHRFSGWSDDLLGAKPYSIADETLLKVAEKAGKPSFQEITKAQIPLLQKAGITDNKDLVEYTLSSVTDGQVLRETTEAVLTGKMTEAEAVAKLKSDFAKLKAEKPNLGAMRMEDMTPAERAEYQAWSANVDRQVRDPLPSDFGLTESGAVPRTMDPATERMGALFDEYDDAHNTLMALKDDVNSIQFGGSWPGDNLPTSSEINKEWTAAKLRYAMAKQKYLAAKAKNPSFNETAWYTRFDDDPKIDYGLTPEEAFNPFGTDDDFLPFRAANPRSRFMLNYAYRPVYLRNAWVGTLPSWYKPASSAMQPTPSPAPVTQTNLNPPVQALPEPVDTRTPFEIYADTTLFGIPLPEGYSEMERARLASTGIFSEARNAGYQQVGSGGDLTSTVMQQGGVIGLSPKPIAPVSTPTTAQVAPGPAIEITAAPTNGVRKPLTPAQRRAMFAKQSFRNRRDELLTNAWAGRASPMSDAQRRAMFAKRSAGGASSSGSGSSRVSRAQPGGSAASAGYTYDADRQGFVRFDGAFVPEDRVPTSWLPDQNQASIQSQLASSHGTGKITAQPALSAPVQGGGAVAAPPNDGYAYRYDPALQSWVRGPALSAINWPDASAALQRAAGVVSSTTHSRPLVGSDPITWSPSRPASSQISDVTGWSSNYQNLNRNEVERQQAAAAAQRAGVVATPAFYADYHNQRQRDPRLDRRHVAL